jgi:hypothetical protein
MGSSSLQAAARTCSSTYPVGKYQHATATITAPNGRVVSWEFVLSESGVSYQRTPYQLSEYSRLESQLKSDVVSFLEKV